MTAAEIVSERVPYLVALVRGDAERLREEEEPQGEPISTFFEYLPCGGVLVGEGFLDLSTQISMGTLELQFSEDPEWVTQLFDTNTFDQTLIGQALLTRVDTVGADVAHAEEALRANFNGPVWRGRWVRLTSNPSSTQHAALMMEAVAAQPTLATRSFNSGYEVVGLVFQEEVQQGVFEDAWMFLILKEPNPPTANDVPLTLLRGMRYSRADLGQRIPELVPLQERIISLIGLGTLGSEVAWDLARAQCRELRVADFDHIEAGTAVRWIRGLPVAGGIKPHALKVLIEADYPYVDVQPFTVMVGATPTDRPVKTEGDILDEWLEGAHLVIDTTAEQNTRRAIAYLAHELGVPQVFAWSVDGYGGVVAGIRPGETGCLLCLERALSPETGFIIPPPHSTDPERVRVQPRGCGDRTFTGASIDLAPLAIEATRMAVSILCSGSDGGYPQAPHPVLVLGLRNSEGQLVVPHWSGYDLTPNPETCPLCASVE